jgi:GntR family transcriptional regulator/MocR family aminotransferase
MRRAALLEALAEHLGAHVEVSGANAGVHLLLWLRDVPPSRVGGVIEQAARLGVGLYPVTPYYIEPPPRAGLLLGYASMTEAEIHAGIRGLATVLDRRQYAI